jgi:hypothetical protein
MHCSACGVEAAAACDCGAPYIPAGAAAAKAVAAHPEKSNRAIAAETGIPETTVRRSRAGAPKGATDTRVGKDGKTYPAKKAKARKQPEKKSKPKISESELDADSKEAADLLRAITDNIKKWHKDMRSILFELLWDEFPDELLEASHKPCPCGGTMRLKPMPAENAPPPDIGAENMRAQIAALDDGLDIPKSLRRTP